MSRRITAVMAVTVALSAAVTGALLRWRASDTPTTVVEINRDATRLVVNGEKFFPIGIYHTSWAGTDAQKRTALEAIAAAGFNLMHPALELDDEDMLDRAAKLGIYLIIEANDPEGIEAMVEAFKDHPAVLGWLIADDFNGIPPKSPDDIAQLNSTVKAIAPHHFTYMSGSVRNLEQYVGLTDIIGIQTFSIPYDPLDLTHRFLASAIQTVTPTGETIFANLQSFTSKGRRVPTGDEVRNITYQALINGVDGLLYYTYFDQVWDMETQPQLWAEMIRIVAEVHELTPVILNGDLVQIPGDTTGLLLSQWTYEGTRYLVLINTLEETLENLSLPVNAGSITPLFADRPSGFTLQNGSLVGTLAPTMVDIYQLNN